MDFADSHVGFHADAPENVVWSQTSFIESVLPVERISMRKVASIYAICMFGSFILSFILFWLPVGIKKFFPEVQSSEILTVFPMIFILLGTLLALLSGHFLKRTMIRKLQRRSNLSFTPDSQCLFVGIEDAFTYDKKKLTADDFGLLKIDSGRILLEMENFRAHLDISDIRANLFHTAKNLAGVRLTVPHSNWTWSVVLSPVGNFKFATEVSAVKKSKRLLEILAEAGVSSARESTAADSFAETKTQSDQLDGETDLVEPIVISDQIDDINADITQNRYEKIIEAIRQKQEKKGWLKNIGILAISLLIFFQLGFFSWGLQTVLMILLVLFVHEMGHFIGMKIFGYKDIKMFFIPMLGAAVSGQGHHVASWKKATVFLLGPLPGILISLIIFVMYIINPRDLYLKIGCMFLLINLLNLLPIYPLDGGRFVHLVLFSRNRFLELAMNIITAALLLILGFATKSWFIKMLGFFNLLGISYKFKLAGKAKQLKSELIEAGPDMSDAEHQSDQIPEHILKHIITWIHQNMPGSMKPKTMADVALQLWERIKIHPPRVGATIILLVVFFIGYVFSFVSIGALAVSFYKNNGYSSEIIEYQKQDGTIGYKEQVSFMKKLSSETELSDDQQFYHGSHEEYGFDGKISAQGQWNMGTRADHWKHFDQDGSLIREVHYESGLPVLTKSLQDGKWHQNKWEDLSLQAKELHRQTAGFQQGPNKLPEYDYSKMIFDPNVVTSAPTLSVQ